MLGLNIEQYSLNSSTSLSSHIAHHMGMRLSRGRIAVVAEEPTNLMPAVKKQWLSIIRQVEKEQAGAFSSTKAELSNKVARMLGVRFTSKPPVDLLEADVSFATAEQFIKVPPICQTLYVTYDIDKEKLHMMTSWMPKHGLVVMYRQEANRSH